eukprot:CAMPEP_0114147778 /NCGR_PEP_ID=MMETSP0043_2-20121206/21285_1 /TAXON_ID=464988 /ORGANISM="Hemiselmis andersenii, Strain CCMP644" /LENGTH=61 /DNA_ID=CAMNT_0001242333 /DNA_START=538 /DNA_END=723 /DNA_ORIENTATION=-
MIECLRYKMHHGDAKSVLDKEECLRDVSPALCHPLQFYASSMPTLCCPSHCDPPYLGDDTV